MLKRFTLILLFCVIMPSFGFAIPAIDTKLKAEYGPDLRKVPYFLSFSFRKQYDRDWSTTFYSERKEFLINYEETVKKENAKERAESKAEALKEKQYLQDKRDAIKKEYNRKKAEYLKEKAEKDASDAEQKAFDTQVHNQTQIIQTLQQELLQEKESNRLKN